jgi:hypothetical protein
MEKASVMYLSANALCNEHRRRWLTAATWRRWQHGNRPTNAAIYEACIHCVYKIFHLISGIAYIMVEAIEHPEECKAY